MAAVSSNNVRVRRHVSPHPIFLNVLQNKKSPVVVASGDFFHLHLQFCHQFVVRFGVFALEVLHEAATFTDLLDQTAAGGKILLVRAQVIRKFFDFFRQNRDLDLRGTRIRRMNLVLLNNALLLICIQHVVFRFQSLVSDP